jgi:hypothetical protein
MVLSRRAGATSEIGPAKLRAPGVSDYAKSAIRGVSLVRADFLARAAAIK